MLGKMVENGRENVRKNAVTEIFISSAECRKVTGREEKRRLEILFKMLQGIF
jgi:hypothetical protein